MTSIVVPDSDIMGTKDTFVRSLHIYDAELWLNSLFLTNNLCRIMTYFFIRSAQMKWTNDKFCIS